MRATISFIHSINKRRRRLARSSSLSNAVQQKRHTSAAAATGTHFACTFRFRVQRKTCPITFQIVWSMSSAFHPFSFAVLFDRENSDSDNNNNRASRKIHFSVCRPNGRTACWANCQPTTTWKNVTIILQNERPICIVHGWAGPDQHGQNIGHEKVQIHAHKTTQNNTERHVLRC